MVGASVLNIVWAVTNKCKSGYSGIFLSQSITIFHPPLPQPAALNDRRDRPAICLVEVWMLVSLALSH